MSIHLKKLTDLQEDTLTLLQKTSKLSPLFTPLSRINANIKIIVDDLQDKTPVDNQDIEVIKGALGQLKKNIQNISSEEVKKTYEDYVNTVEEVIAPLAAPAPLEVEESLKKNERSHSSQPKSRTPLHEISSNMTTFTPPNAQEEAKDRSTVDQQTSAPPSCGA